jgi:hypothetical protein
MAAPHFFLCDTYNYGRRESNVVQARERVAIHTRQGRFIESVDQGGSGVGFNKDRDWGLWLS